LPIELQTEERNMSKTAIAAAVLMAMGAPAAFAGPSFDDYARVTQVTPEYQRVNVPRQECYSEYVPERHSYRGNSLAGSIIGGVTGGLLGAQVGHGNGRVAASATGATIGAIVGNRLGARNDRDEYYEREVRRCRTVDSYEDHLTGYRVAYEYQGRSYATVLPYDPGSRLPVHVDVTPISRLGPDYDPR
jgi:uncharacterized protein YcfJ